MTNDELLIEISNKVAAIQVSVDNMKEAIAKNTAEDQHFAKRLDEYFEYAKNRQDNIKKELEIRLDRHETRITSLEQGTQRTLYKWWNWSKDKLITAILLGIGALIYKYVLGGA